MSKSFFPEDRRLLVRSKGKNSLYRRRAEPTSRRRVEIAREHPPANAPENGSAPRMALRRQTQGSVSLFSGGISGSPCRRLRLRRGARKSSACDPLPTRAGISDSLSRPSAGVDRRPPWRGGVPTQIARRSHSLCRDVAPLPHRV